MYFTCVILFQCTVRIVDVTTFIMYIQHYQYTLKQKCVVLTKSHVLVMCYTPCVVLAKFRRVIHMLCCTPSPSHMITNNSKYRYWTGNEAIAIQYVLAFATLWIKSYQFIFESHLLLSDCKIKRRIRRHEFNGLKVVNNIA